MPPSPKIDHGVSNLEHSAPLAENARGRHGPAASQLNGPAGVPFPQWLQELCPEGSFQASPNSERCLGIWRIQRNGRERGRVWAGNMMSKQHAASRVVRFLVRRLTSLTFICNGGNKISPLSPSQHSRQMLPSPQTEISVQA